MGFPNPGAMLLTILLTLSIPLQAVEMFRQPVSPTPLPVEAAKSCDELEREIAQLTPLTYSYKPSFYNNPYQGAAMIAGTISSSGYFVYSAYDYFLDYRENTRILPALDSIERLRHLKAEKHCFEN